MIDLSLLRFGPHNALMFASRFTKLRNITNYQNNQPTKIDSRRLITDSEEWLKCIQDGKAIGINQKEKFQTIIDSLRTNPAESERIGLNLDDVAKIIISFENPTIEEKDLSLTQMERR